MNNEESVDQNYVRQNHMGDRHLHAAEPQQHSLQELVSTLLLASWMPNRSKSVKQDNGSTESPVDFFVSRRDTRCGPQSEAKLVMGRHGRESTQRDHVIIGIRLMTRHQVTNPGPKTVSDVTRSLAGEQKVHQGHVFVRIAQGAPALMLLQCEESGSVVTPPQGSTTSLEFEGHTTGIVPFIEIAAWKSAPTTELPKDAEENAFCSPGHAPNEHREMQLRRFESSMPQPIPSRRQAFAKHTGHKCWKLSKARHREHRGSTSPRLHSVCHPSSVSVVYLDRTSWGRVRRNQLLVGKARFVRGNPSRHGGGFPPASKKQAGKIAQFGKHPQSHYKHKLRVGSMRACLGQNALRSSRLLHRRRPRECGYVFAGQSKPKLKAHTCSSQQIETRGEIGARRYGLSAPFTCPPSTANAALRAPLEWMRNMCYCPRLLKMTYITASVVLTFAAPQEAAKRVLEPMAEHVFGGEEASLVFSGEKRKNKHILADSARNSPSIYVLDAASDPGQITPLHNATFLELRRRAVRDPKEADFIFVDIDTLFQKFWPVYLKTSRHKHHHSILKCDTFKQHLQKEMVYVETVRRFLHENGNSTKAKFVYFYDIDNKGDIATWTSYMSYKSRIHKREILALAPIPKALYHNRPPSSLRYKYTWDAQRRKRVRKHLNELGADFVFLGNDIVKSDAAAAPSINILPPINMYLATTEELKTRGERKYLATFRGREDTDRFSKLEHRLRLSHQHIRDVIFALNGNRTNASNNSSSSSSSSSSSKKKNETSIVAQAGISSSSSSSAFPSSPGPAKLDVAAKFDLLDTRVEEGPADALIDAYRNSEFALSPGGTKPYSFRPGEALTYGAIPVIIIDDTAPIHSRDWEKWAVLMREKQVAHCVSILEAIPQWKRDAMFLEGRKIARCVNSVAGYVDCMLETLATNFL
eukprot:jgi/Bigna1/76286/fgenesh1_pg.40_\